MIAVNIRRLGGYLLLAFAVTSGGLAWWQVVEGPSLAARQDNPQVIAARQSAPRGSIFDATGSLLASSVVVDGISRRTYLDPAFTHLIGYASPRFGTTGVERAWDDLLTGRTDPDPLRSVLDEILARDPSPKDMVLTIDRRLQDFALLQLGADVGAVVAIDPSSGAVLAMVSTPTYDPTPFAGDPRTAQAPWDAIAANPDEPFVDRARQGHYTPGSIMKVFTAAAALDAGAITAQTTFPDQPAQERDGFVVEGFTIREHDLGDVEPALWAVSPALAVSSNIFFAHVGLELGSTRFGEYARRFGFCSPVRIGDQRRFLPADSSRISERSGDGCVPFADDVELASAAFGQAQVEVTPLQMALLAAAVANEGMLPEPFVVRDVRPHVANPARGASGEVLEAYDGGSHRVISSRTAAVLREAMIQAVVSDLGRPYAGNAAVTLYGARGAATAGKTGTAERGPGLPPHSWFIGFAPAQQGETPAIAIAVIVEGGGTGSGRAAPIGGAVMAEWLRLLAGGR